MTPARQHYHFAGVAGVGMSALAQAAAAQGATVSGSDRYHDEGADIEVIRQLAAAGIRFRPQDGSGIEPATAGLVISTAIEADNPDIRAARERGVPVLHRSELLARLVEGKRCIAITGTSGKSTVTGMVGHLMEQLGADPTVVNGAAVLNWADRGAIGNFRAGRSDWWVIEADESDRSLLNYHPAWAVITNASADHFELEETLALFEAFKLQVSTGLVSALDEPELLRGLPVRTHGDAVLFPHEGVSFRVPLRGRHNAANARLALTLCRRMGFGLDRLQPALATFRGLRRRLESVGSANGIAVFDDYAHNPAKIRAAWQAMATDKGGVLGIWRPHGFRPLASMLEDLAETFREVCAARDRLFVLPVYDAGGTADRSVSSSELVERAAAHGVANVRTAEPDELPRLIRACARPGDAVLVMGARDPGLPALAARILAALA